MNLLLTRHGETADNVGQRFGGHSPTPLTERGRDQAACLARAVTGVTRIISSDLARAAETAAIVGAELGLAVEQTPVLRERDAGDFTGLSFAEARERDAALMDLLLVQHDPNARPPNGENAADIRARIEPLFANLDGTVLIVSHGYTLSVALELLLGSNAGFYTHHCALHRIEITNRVRVHAINDTRHLGEIRNS